MTESKPENLLKFPVKDFPIKVMGLMSDHFAKDVCDVAARLDPHFDAAKTGMRPSKNKKYLAVSIYVSADSQQQLDAIYRTLTALPAVKYML